MQRNRITEALREEPGGATLGACSLKCNGSEYQANSAPGRLCLYLFPLEIDKARPRIILQTTVVTYPYSSNSIQLSQYNVSCHLL